MSLKYWLAYRDDKLEDDLFYDPYILDNAYMEIFVSQTYFYRTTFNIPKTVPRYTYQTFWLITAAQVNSLVDSTKLAVVALKHTVLLD